MHIRILTITGLLLLASPALALTDPEKSDVTTLESSIKPDSSTIKCKRIEITGSLIRRKKCMTVAQWAAMTSAGGDQARKIVDHANRGATSGQ